jgi:hypothetical protein
MCMSDCAGCGGGQVNLSSNGGKMRKAYESVCDKDSETNWWVAVLFRRAAERVCVRACARVTHATMRRAIFGYVGKTDDLDLVSTGGASPLGHALSLSLP